ncbi:hypothetical protein [Citrobacter sedlakii]|nr:hypothetical protein [Citrobacter sedlakii]
MVYVDNDSAIKVAESFKTTPEDDALIKNIWNSIKAKQEMQILFIDSAG